MADMALGIATVLMHSHDPDPLQVEFRCEAPGAVARLVDLVIDECSDAGFQLTSVMVPANLVTGLGTTHDVDGVRIEAKPELRDEVLFFRRKPRARS